MAWKDLSVIFENEDFIAVNKDSGMLTIPDRFDDTQPSLYRTLSARFGKIFIVHRLDRDTSGVVLFAKNETSHKYLSQLFEKRNIEKIYFGIVRGSLDEPAGMITEPIAEHAVHKGTMVVHKKGKPSTTAFEVVADFGMYSAVQFNIQSGRTHQIRVHMQFTGHPVACDVLYGDGQPVLVSSFKKKYKLSKSEEQEKPILQRLALHSYQLKFKDAHSREYVLEAPLPRDLKALLQQLKKYRS